MAEVNFTVSQESLALVQSTTIEANFDECKAALIEMVEPYKSLIVTEEGISDAKADRAKLRKVSSRIDEMRKAVKKAYTEPLTIFENRCKELVSIIQEGSNNLDEQVKSYEQNEAKKKIAALRNEYIALSDDEVEEYCPFEFIRSDKWENKGYSYDTALGEIKSAIANTKNDIETIRNMGGDDTLYLLSMYKQSHDLSFVVRTASKIDTMRKLEEAKKREEEANAAREAAWKQEEDSRRQAEAARAKAETEVQEKVFTVDFRVFATKQQLTELGAFMKTNGIKYAKIEG